MSEPGHLLPSFWPGEHGITADELQRWAAEWERQSRGPARLLTPLPRRVRARLWLAGRIDAAGCWLIEHDHLSAARVLWRIR